MNIRKSAEDYLEQILMIREQKGTVRSIDIAAGLGVSVDNRLISEGWPDEVVTLPFDPPQSIVLGIAVPSLREATPAATQEAELSLSRKLLRPLRTAEAKLLPAERHRLKAEALRIRDVLI